MGEWFVGAYLKQVKGCNFVDYNVRAPGGSLKGLKELDVIGLDFDSSRAYLCEVTTHIWGLNYGTFKETKKKIRTKHKWQKTYASEYLTKFNEKHFMFWCPYVPVGQTTTWLETLTELECVINQDFTEKVNELIKLAKGKAPPTENPFFRTLQILENLRK